MELRRLTKSELANNHVLNRSHFSTTRNLHISHLADEKKMWFDKSKGGGFKENMSLQLIFKKISFVGERHFEEVFFDRNPKKITKN